MGREAMGGVGGNGQSDGGQWAVESNGQGNVGNGQRPSAGPQETIGRMGMGHEAMDKQLASNGKVHWEATVGF